MPPRGEASTDNDIRVSSTAAIIPGTRGPYRGTRGHLRRQAALVEGVSCAGVLSDEVGGDAQGDRHDGGG